MPTLILMKSPTGAAPGETIPLDGEMFVVGRDAEECQIVIPHHAVSRKHAQIIRASGQYYIEDLKSRNHTFLNNKPVDGRALLRPDDRIKICDFLFRFQDERKSRPDLPAWMKPDKEKEKDDEEGGGMTTVEATYAQGSAKNFLDTQPSDRLRALLEISTSLSKTLELEPLLPQIADTLFSTFRQADRCFIIMLDETGKPVPKVVKSRRPGMDDARFSRTIVRKTLETKQAYLSEDASNDADLGPAASIAEFKIRSVMCVPLLTSEGKPLGSLQLDTNDRAKKFREDDLKLLTIVANLATVAIEKARMHHDLMHQQKEAKEVELARAVQLGFLPQTTPQIPGYDFYNAYSPAKTVGGDYYDYIQMPNNRLAVVLGDVAGKGVPAALLVAKLSSEVRFCLLTEPDPAKAIGLLNDQLLRGGLGDRFVTLAAVILDPAAHTVTVVNAGHMSPILYRPGTNEMIETISSDASGLPLGTMPGWEYQSATVDVQVGDVVSVFTDGVNEAMAPDETFFGEDRIKKVYQDESATAGADCTPSGIGSRLLTAVRKHANGRAQNDDIAIVCVGRSVPGAPKSVSAEPATGVIKRSEL
jgi:serine phosphatase RsbU (regulator of sigma subunit)